MRKRDIFADIHVRSISVGIDPAMSMGWLLLNMLATLAENAREPIAERDNAGIQPVDRGARIAGRCRMKWGKRLAVTARIEIDQGYECGDGGI
ncbi:hypothetical protein [Herbiconiux sp. YIM B11900]|uniref:hypothetical protein n=1 Tax=Herbiconiux sp. YIM B11900 TaxID=3404131 RepID=UPI003F8558D2